MTKKKRFHRIYIALIIAITIFVIFMPVYVLDFLRLPSDSISDTVTEVVDIIDIETPLPTIINTAISSAIPKTNNTTTPFPTTVSKPKYYCTVNATFSTDSMAPKLYYGLYNNTSGANMTAAQWDFNGDGKWDTDLSINNGTLDHNFTNPGSYNVKLRLQISDGGYTDICNKNITVPQESEFYQGNFSGKVFRDNNCNNVWDIGEIFLSGITVSFMRSPEWFSKGTATTDGSGNFSFNTSIKNGETLTLQPTLVAPSGYKIRYTTPAYTITSGNKNVSTTISLIPNESVNMCP